MIKNLLIVSQFNCIIFYALRKDAKRAVAKLIFLYDKLSFSGVLDWAPLTDFYILKN